jgi:prephenate dehydrogenase
MWRDIVLANRKHVARSVNAFIAELQQFESVLKSADPNAITKFFETAKTRRDNWRAKIHNSKSAS